MKSKVYKLCAVGLAITGLSLTAAALSVSAQQKKPAPASKPAATKPATTKPAAEKASSGMAGPDKLVPADLEYQGHECNVLVPGDRTLSEYETTIGKVFCFKGQPHPDQKVCVFNVTISPPPSSGIIPGERTMMEAMLSPQKQALKNYKEEKQPTFVNGGHSFKGMGFSGTAANGENRRGFVYLTQAKDTFFVLFAQDEEPFASKQLPLLLKTAQGCKIKAQ